jgi:hypothetical protein
MTHALTVRQMEHCSMMWLDVSQWFHIFWVRVTCLSPMTNTFTVGVSVGWTARRPHVAHHL